MLKKLAFLCAVALLPSPALADGSFFPPYPIPVPATQGGTGQTSYALNCVVAASSTTALTCTTTPTISGANISAGTIPSSALGTVAVAQGGTNLISLAGSKCIRSASTTALAEASADCGTVTSVGLSAPGVLYSVSGSPVTGSGTLALSLLTQTANTVLAGPTSGGAATPTMRALVAADINGLSPTFTNTLTAQGCIGTVCATGIGANDLSVANGTGGKIWIGSAGTNYLNLSGSTLQVGGGNLAILSGNSVTTGNSTFGSTNIVSGGTMQAKIGSVVSYLAPNFTAAGAAVASTMHCVTDTVTAAGASTIVSLSAPSAFASANYSLSSLWDATALVPVAASSVTAQSSSSFTFTSINAHVYAYHICAP